MAAGVQQTAGSDPCANKTASWGVCRNDDNPPSDQGQSYSRDDNEEGQKYSQQQLQDDICVETNCEVVCSEQYCRGNSTGGGADTNDFTDVVVVENSILEDEVAFCCAPYTFKSCLLYTSPSPRDQA